MISDKEIENEAIEYVNRHYWYLDKEPLILVRSPEEERMFADGAKWMRDQMQAKAWELAREAWSAARAEEGEPGYESFVYESIEYWDAKKDLRDRINSSVDFKNDTIKLMLVTSKERGE